MVEESVQRRCAAARRARVARSLEGPWRALWCLYQQTRPVRPFGVRSSRDHAVARRGFGAFDTPWLKPDAEFARHALTELNAVANTTCLIGDSPYDVEAALNGGFVCYCVTTGTHDADQLRAAGAAGVYDDLIALSKAEFAIELSAES